MTHSTRSYRKRRLKRKELAQAWLNAHFAPHAVTLMPASADASFRRYFRVMVAGQTDTYILMDAPPDKENCAPFVQVASLLLEAGLTAPKILAQDLSQGFLLLTDLGRATLLEHFNTFALDPVQADPYMRASTRALVKWQQASKPGVLPAYDEALLRKELALFPEWFVGRHLGLSLDAKQQSVLEEAFDALVESALAQPCVYVHRDFMPRNLMLSPEGAQGLPGILDFQDAVYGPITYDIASLTRDAFHSWDEEYVLDWTVRYWEAARTAGLPVEDDFSAFYRAFEWMGLQRHLKVAGIFCRLTYRDGKAKYLEDVPRFMGYIRATAHRYSRFTPLLRLIDTLENIETKTGLTF